MTVRFRDFLKEQLQDEGFREEYESLEADEAIIRAMITAQEMKGMTSEELAKRAGISEVDIMGLETWNGNPKLETLKGLARAMNMRIKLEFYPV